jgi:hypothetical protein
MKAPMASSGPPPLSRRQPAIDEPLELQIESVTSGVEARLHQNSGNKPACIKTACGTKTMVKDFETDGLAASWRRRLTFGAQ